MIQDVSRHPRELLRFISNIKLDNNNNLILNLLDTTPSFVTRFYTPNFSVSVLASNVLAKLERNTILASSVQLANSNLVHKVNTSGMKLKRPDIYLLLRTVVLETFSLIYTIREDNSLIKYLSLDEIKLTRANLRYILTEIGADEAYSPIIQDLHNLDIALGYIQAQVPVIKEALGNG